MVLRWVYTIKDGPNNEEIFKACYVAKGYILRFMARITMRTGKMTPLQILVQWGQKYMSAYLKELLTLDINAFYGIQKCLPVLEIFMSAKKHDKWLKFGQNGPETVAKKNFICHFFDIGILRQKYPKFGQNP